MELDEFIIPELNKAINIAKRTDDVEIIANKLNIPKSVIEIVKRHYFIDEHFVLVGNKFQLGRFERFPGDSDEWLKFVNKPIEEISEIDKINFKWLIAHEYIEAKLMEKGVNFRSFVNPENKFIYDNGAHWESISFNNIKLQYDINNGLPLNIKKYYFYENLGKTESTIFPNEQLSNLDEVVNQIIKINQLK